MRETNKSNDRNIKTNYREKLKDLGSRIGNFETVKCKNRSNRSVGGRGGGITSNQAGLSE